MAEIEGPEKLLSFEAAKRFGKHRFYGQSMYAFSEYGEQEIYIRADKGPPIKYVSDEAGNPIDFAGIYRRDNVTGKIIHYREPYYIPKNPRTEDQQAQRAKITAGVAEWQALTEEQKEVYNKRAKRKKISGYNLFIKEYLLSH
jgi:hypothetical protein